jgi:hypothetical protein
MSRTAPVARAGTVSRALARDRLGVPSVLAFVLASIAAMTVCAGVIPTACVPGVGQDHPIVRSVIWARVWPKSLGEDRQKANRLLFCWQERPSALALALALPPSRPEFVERRNPERCRALSPFLQRPFHGVLQVERRGRRII